MSSEGEPGMVIAPHLLEAMIAHCLEERPYEACGLLTGNAGQVRHGYATDSLYRLRAAYQVDPLQQAQILADMALRGEALIGIYHSHPTGHPYPSPGDIRLAVHCPEAFRLIVCLRGPAEVRAFRIQEGQVQEIVIETPAGEEGEWHDLRRGQRGREDPVS